MTADHPTPDDASADGPTPEAAPPSGTADGAAARSWRMHAGVADRGGYQYFGDPRYVELYGVVPVPVVVTEDPDGTYWGWLDARRDAPEMIQPHPVLYQVQFPYGPDAEERAGRGRTLRLTVTAGE